MKSPSPVVLLSSALCFAFALAACDGGSEEGGQGGAGGSSASGGSSSSGGAASGGGSSSGGAASGGGSGGDEVLTVIDGVSIPWELDLCDQSLIPGISSSNISFEWSEVPDATGYAIRAFVTEGEFVEISDDFVVFSGIQTDTQYSFDEKVSGRSYRIEVYAVVDTTPLCTLSGFNGVGPLP